jgi:hypothetical protein
MMPMRVVNSMSQTASVVKSTLLIPSRDVGRSGQQSE